MLIKSIRSCSCQDLDNIQLTCENYNIPECWIFDTPSPGYNVDPNTYINPETPNIRHIGVITIELLEESINIIY